MLVELELLPCGFRPLGAAEGDAVGAAQGEGLLGALGDEVALDFGGEAEGEGEHLALDVIAEAVVVLNGPHAALLGHADVEDLHHHEEVAAEAGELRAYDEVVGCYVVEELAELALGVAFGAADGFFNPSIDGEVLRLAEA